MFSSRKVNRRLEAYRATGRTINLSLAVSRLNNLLEIAEHFSLMQSEGGLFTELDAACNKTLPSCIREAIYYIELAEDTEGAYRDPKLQDVQSEMDRICRKAIDSAQNALIVSVGLLDYLPGHVKGDFEENMTVLP